MGGNLSPNNRDPASAGYSYSQTGEGVQKKLHYILIYKCRRIANTLWSICPPKKTTKKNKLIDWLIQFNVVAIVTETLFSDNPLVQT